MVVCEKGYGIKAKVHIKSFYKEILVSFLVFFINFESVHSFKFLSITCVCNLLFLFYKTKKNWLLGGVH